MQHKDIQIGGHFAYREKAPLRGAPIEHVEILDKARRGRWKVRWTAPNPGLVDFAP